MATLKNNSSSSKKRVVPQMCPHQKFPVKLWNLLGECNDGAISWSEDGVKIHIHKEEFVTSPIVQKYFVAKLRSFIRQLNLYGFHKISAFHHPEVYHTLGTAKCMCSHNLPYMVYQRNGFHRGMNPANLPSIKRRTKVAAGQENMDQDSDDGDDVSPHSNIEKLEVNWMGDNSGNAQYMNSLKVAAETGNVKFVPTKEEDKVEAMDLTEDDDHNYCSVMDFNSMQMSADSNDEFTPSGTDDFVDLQVVESFYDVDGTEEFQVEFIYGTNEPGNINLIGNNINNNGFF